ncbi:magnesium transporter CorA family protein [Rhodococcus sp. (in: high G+C Gram-positive bacteria)]|nr:magnesium transporter CorA family protein [Rhodococcus sp. (in: high G+C Gram-positive bacteria)]MBF0663073.1 magnesium transporter CorA family protein [Rhodococcus sp. (in: high G+C Gram-positive bacteria)]
MTTIHDGQVRTRVWRSGKVEGDNVPFADISDYLQDPDCLVWVDLLDPKPERLFALAEELSFDPHAVEDALARGERTKATRYATHTFLTVYATHLATGPDPAVEAYESRLSTTRISAFLLPGCLVTVRSRGPFDMDDVVTRWDANPDLLKFGTAALLHGLLDVVVDGQFDTIRDLDDAIEEIEDGLFADEAQPKQIQRAVYRLRKELVQLRRVVLPMREVVNAVMHFRAEHGIAPGLDGWYTDLYDHVLRATEWTESLRDMVTTVFETNLSLQDARLNTVMKKLTGWAAIIAVPTAVTGWFGMNVPFPGSGEEMGVLAVAVIVFFSAAVLFVLFKRRDWL